MSGEPTPGPWWKEVDPKGRLFGDGSPLCLVKSERGIVAEIASEEDADVMAAALALRDALFGVMASVVTPPAYSRPEADEIWRSALDALDTAGLSERDAETLRRFVQEYRGWGT